MPAQPLTIKRRMFEVLITLAVLLSVIAGGLWLILARPVIGVTEPAGAVPSPDPQRLRVHVEYIVNSHHPRDYVNVENLDAVADYIAAEFTECGGRVSFEEYRTDGLEYRNVICLFGPAEGPRVVIGAHYDAAYDTPGADDNASGVAGILELARMFKERPPPGTVEIVAWTLEEPPFFGTPEMGSAVHARERAGTNTDIRLVIALETIGYFTDEPGSQDFPSPLLRLYYPGTGNFAAVVGITSQGGTVARVKKLMRGAAGLPVHAIAAPAVIPGIDFSDHRNYWEYGYDAVMVTDTAFFRNKNYHTLHDTPDRLDYDRMADTVRGVYSVALHFSE